MDKLVDDDKLKRYLLGDLPLKESEELDLRIISDETLEEYLHSAEDRLIEEYLEGEFSESESKLFNQNFLVSKERKEQIETIFLLKQYAKKATTDESHRVRDAEIEQDPGFFRKLTRTFALSPVQVVTASLIIVGLIGIVWVMIAGSAKKLSPLESEFAELNKGDLGDVSLYEKSSRLALFGGASRGGSNPNVLDKQKLVRKVLFQLALPQNSNVDHVYKIELIRDKKVVFTLMDISTYKNKSGEELRFVLASKTLNGGSYQIKATAADGRGQYLYSFSVR